MAYQLQDENAGQVSDTSTSEGEETPAPPVAPVDPPMESPREPAAPALIITPPSKPPVPMFETPTPVSRSAEGQFHGSSHCSSQWSKFFSLLKAYCLLFF